MGKNSDTRLKKVINLEFITLTLVAIAVTMVLSTFIFYEVYKAEIIRDMRKFLRILEISMGMIPVCTPAWIQMILD